MRYFDVLLRDCFSRLRLGNPERRSDFCKFRRNVFDAIDTTRFNGAPTTQVGALTHNRITHYQPPAKINKKRCNYLTLT